MGNRQAVITGYGVKAPQTSRVQDYLQILQQGMRTHESVAGIGPGGEALVCGVVDEPLETFQGKRLKHYPRSSLLALHAAQEAFESAGLENPAQYRIGVILGTCTGGLPEAEMTSYHYRANDLRSVPLKNAGLTNIHSLSSSVASHFGLSQEVFTISNGCCSGNDSLYLAKRLIEAGVFDLCVTGASETPLCHSAIASFLKQRAITLDCSPEKTGNPFSRGNDDFVIAEAAAVVILEARSHAESRQAPIRALLSDAAVNNDTVSIHLSDASGDSMLRNTSLVAEGRTIDYVNSQALGLSVNDGIELRLSRELFGHQVPFTTIKGMYGHAFGTSPVLQTISSVLSLEHSFIPPTIKTTKEGFEDMPIITECQHQHVRHVLVTSHGYGGNNNSLIVSRP
ncbi:beta-ketoacyl-[acyl-carrier-protein] synthase family protein [Gorillibacterium sp. sgz5001074]|uniref:beta-ketoacyl-[acyl-carrier-protein] synthase family protein n=1 Tax=Gorillibacterium sp. sgz5001074 TaxID=3446695 RepID=UPI003F673086